MYLCICNAVGEKDYDKYHLIGTQCGKCVYDGGELGSTGINSVSGEQVRKPPQAQQKK
tara:strand:+ start:427 stop:600 length:174 start_codon:yes stop_codon:yes gene_type:complete